MKLCVGMKHPVYLKHPVEMISSGKILPQQNVFFSFDPGISMWKWRLEKNGVNQDEQKMQEDSHLRFFIFKL